jgi:protein-tyrosine phosphatase
VEATQREVVYHFENVYNFRDVGGLKTAEGHVMKTGVLFRSDKLSRMTCQDLAKLQEFNITLICDLRSPKESRKKQVRAVPNQTFRVVNIPIHEPAIQNGRRKRLLSFLFGKKGGDRFWEFARWYYHHIAFERTYRIREVITLLSKAENLPALIHCNSGKDRTGFLAALIQLLVGVPYEMVMQDYLRTNDYFGPHLEKLIKVMRVLTLYQVSPERMRLVLTAHPEFLNEVHDLIVKKYGSVEKYLCEACEIDRDTLQKLKNQLLT